MSLAQLRGARKLTQETLASVLGVKQSEVSKIERRTDMYLSTIASFIQVMGGTLEMRAVFPKGEIIKINQFKSVADPETMGARAKVAKRHLHPAPRKG